MNFDAFRSTVSSIPVLGRQILRLFLPDEPHLEVQISRWRRKGKIVPLTRTLFVLGEADRKINPSRLYLACEMYKPSYISLEYALSFHGLIPERVTEITCVSTRKTRTIANAFGNFSYRQIKTEGFTGFSSRKDEAGLPYFLAGPEKALVDFVYLNLGKFPDIRKARETLRGSYRLQNTSILDRKRLLQSAGCFGTEKLLKIISEVR